MKILTKLCIQILGGLSAQAVINKYIDYGDDHMLGYKYTVEGKDYSGRVSSGWDIIHAAYSGKLPRWKDKYIKGYSFPIRYCRHFPQVHTVEEQFDFRI